MPESENRGPEGVGPDDPGQGPTLRPASLDAGPTLRPGRPATGSPTASQPAADSLSQAETIRGRKPGDRVFNGRYELKRILGRGGMGVVWLALDRELEHEVALKFLPEVMACNEAAILDLKRETKKALQLAHAHIVKTHGWERDAESAAVSMEFVDGRTLAALKAEREHGCLEVGEIREWVRQLCEALEYAHAMVGVVHRDLKPLNLMVNGKGHLKVTDFGIARSLAESLNASSAKGGGGVSGTPGYMSPQQWEGKRAGVADDVYALGATLYDLLTGKAPFYAGNVERQAKETVPPSMAERRRDLGVEGGEAIPAKWEAVVAACLAKEPGQRPGSAKAVWEGLEGKESNLRGAETTAEATPTTGAATGKDATRAATQYRPNRMGKWLAVAAVLVLVAFGAWRLGPGRKEADSSTAPKGMSNAVASPPVQPARAVTGQVTQVPAKPDEAQVWRQAEAKAKSEQEAAAKVQAQREAEVQAKQEAARKVASAVVQLPVLKVITNSIGMELVWVAPGTFTMGSPAGEAGRSNKEGPQTEVTLTKGYWLGKFEVTQGEYEALMGSNPSKFRGARLPVETVSWTESVDFCRKLTERERSAGKLPAGYEYRLPTEAQWEYACRAGTRTWFSGGDGVDRLRDLGWYSGNSGSQTSAVGEKKPNAWGLCDMHGNVREWCSDWYGNYPGGSVTDPAGANSGLNRVTRGGSWHFVAWDCRAAFRYENAPEVRDGELGFRAALVSVSSGDADAEVRRSDSGEGRQTSVSRRTAQPFTNSLGMVFEPVPGTQVLFSIWETRVKDYAAYAAANSGVDGRWKTPGFAQEDTHPVVNVSWDDAVAFCRWLTETERKGGRLKADQEYRLPTDTEWSYAVGIGDRETGSTPKEKDGRLKDVYPWGTGWPPPSGAGNYADATYNGQNLLNNSISGYSDGYAAASPVGKFKANAHGLFDMGGNAQEWCQDYYDGQGGNRVLRGASWSVSDARYLLSSYRFYNIPSDRYFNYSFRVVLAGGAATPATGKVNRTPAQPEPAQKSPEGLKSFANKAGTVMTNSIGMELVWIAPGKFTMGSPGSEVGRHDDEGPQTEVTLTKGYWLGKYEVTQGEYEAVMGSNPSNWKGATLPVETVSWTEAVDFCRKLAERERSIGKLPAGYEYRLPTEAQWEYACRAGTRTRFSGGDADGQMGDAGWYSGNSGNQTHPVGQKRPNTWGLYDMHGNVWEWCSDWHGNYPGGSVADPTGAGSGSYRVDRGGSWNYVARYCRSAIRDHFVPDIRFNGLGFRAVLAPVQ